MQGYFQYRRIRKQLEKQHVIKRDMPDDVWTHETRYSFRDGQVQSEQQEIGDDELARRRREHGHLTAISGPRVDPRHSTREHIEHDGDVERADFNPEIGGEPHTINSRDTLGTTPDIMVTGVETPMADGADGVSQNSDTMQKERLVVVTYEGSCDPMDPHNWSFLNRLGSTLVVSLIGATMLWGSTVDAADITTVRKVYSASFDLESLVTGIYLIGLGFGGLLMGPVSEAVGRNAVYVSSLASFALFTLGASVSTTLPGRVVCRFFAGFFGSAPVVCAGGSLVDLWTRTERVYAFPIYSICSFLGSLVAPTPASFIIQTKTMSWRWVDYITILLAGSVLALVVLFQPETYSPILLHWKAKQLRRLTGDTRYRAPLEFKKEPIIMVIAAYLSAIFIILYTFLAGYLYIFSKMYNFNEAQTSMALLGLAVGVLFTLPFVPLAMNLLRKDIYRARARGHSGPGPEISLYMAIFGAPALPIGLFWMGWTACPSISFWSPLAASVLFRWGMLCVFVSSYQYVADAFEDHAASALACINLLRFASAGIMVEIGRPFYQNLGVGLTLTVLGAIATAFLPVPYVLYAYGHVVRRWSRRSVSA